MKTKKTAYLYWLISIFGWLGLHRQYLGRRKPNVLWLCTFGLLGVGSLIDLFLIYKWVNSNNAKIEVAQLEKDIIKLKQIKKIVLNKQNFEAASWYNNKERILEAKIIELHKSIIN